MIWRQSHPTDDDLVLYYYGEHARRARIEEHLDACASCGAAYRALGDTLGLVTAPEAPDRNELYGLEVWQRIRPQLPAVEPRWTLWSALRRPVAAGAIMVVLVAAAFIAGRHVPVVRPASVVSVQAPVALDPAEARIAATLDHLEQSERVLLDISNTRSDRVDFAAAQEWASDLVDANRLYRDAAAQAGADATASLLDELERSLLDVVHAPSTLSSADLQSVLAHLDAAALIFRVRIVSSELRERELERHSFRKTT
jgi:hypothetical protein